MSQCSSYVYFLYIVLISTIWTLTFAKGHSDIDRTPPGKPQKQLAVEASSLSSKPESLPHGKDLDLNTAIGYGNLKGKSYLNLCTSGSRATPHCRNSTSLYRTWDGSCNNPNQPTWGMAGNCFLRINDAVYDGQHGIRKSVKGGPLPPPRDLSVNIFTNISKPDNLSFMFTIFGQFVAHDMSRTLKPLISCCSGKLAKNPSKCAAIQVRPDDPFYSQFNVTCLEFARTKVCSYCKSKKRQQPNSGTPALDGSLVYGTNKKRADQLREFDGTGRLKSEISITGEELCQRPPKNDFPEFCPIGQERNCFYTGDDRTNQHAALTSIQTLWLREHNRIADALATLNPDWDDEKLYQESRRILAAELQSITYHEYLPLVLGPNYMSQYNLSVSPGNQGTNFKPDRPLAIWQEFGVAVFRLHSMVATNVGMRNLTFKDYYSNPNIIREGGADPILQGVCKVPSEQFDRYFIDDVNDYLYREPNMPYGGDLAATDIQRGRDHGLPSYVTILELFAGGNITISCFEDLRSLITDENVKLLKQNYRDVGDVDLFVGLQMEKHIPGAIFGLTSCNIAGRQYFNVKYRDRFFFEHKGEVSSFTPAQRGTLKQSSLSRVMCDNTNEQIIQKNVLLLPGDDNPMVLCNDLPEVDLTLWKSSPET